jgi:hypothetical protein
MLCNMCASIAAGWLGEYIKPPQVEPIRGMLKCILSRICAVYSEDHASTRKKRTTEYATIEAASFRWGKQVKSYSAQAIGLRYRNHASGNCHVHCHNAFMMNFGDITCYLYCATQLYTCDVSNTPTSEWGQVPKHIDPGSISYDCVAALFCCVCEQVVWMAVAFASG